MHLNVAIESISTPPNLLNQCLYWHCWWNLLRDKCDVQCSYDDSPRTMRFAEYFRHPSK